MKIWLSIQNVWFGFISIKVDFFGQDGQFQSIPINSFGMNRYKGGICNEIALILINEIYFLYIKKTGIYIAIVEAMLKLSKRRLYVILRYNVVDLI